MKELNPFEKKNCYDCSYLYSAVTWWCGNEEAIKIRGTKIAGCNHCPFWKPDWKYIKDEYKTEQYGYIKPVNLFKKILKWVGLDKIF